MSDRIRFEALVGDNLLTIGKTITKRVPSVPTPFPTWNELCGEEGGREGVAQKWLAVLGGSDGSGKTYLTANIAAHGVLAGHKAGVINFEMTKVGYTQRYLAILSGEPKYRLEHGRYFDMGSWLRAKKKADEVYEETGGLLITNDSGVFTLDDIEVAYDKLTQQGCDMIFVDYAQLVSVKGAEGIFQRSEAVAEKLRVLTHKYSVASYVVSQFNREGKKLSDPPTRHYLQGGSAWENNANQILLIDHTVRIRDDENHRLFTRLILDKNRHGPMPVEWGVSWNLATMRWEEGEPTDRVTMGGASPDPDEDPTEKEPPPPKKHPHDDHFGPQGRLF